MDDMKTFLSVVRGRSLEAAAEILGVNHSTVYRRLARLEERSGGALFDRQGATYLPTPRAKAILPVALRLERESAAFERSLTARAQELEGRVRVTVPLGLLHLTHGAIAAFHGRHPRVTITLNTSTEVVDLIRGDADIAVRNVDSPNPDLVGRRVATVAWAVYARVRADPTELRWAFYDDRLRRLPAVQYRRRTWPDVLETYQVDGTLAMTQTLTSDDVAGFLPCHMGDTESALVRISEPVPMAGLWVLYAPELRKSRPVQAFSEELIDSLSRWRELLEGNRPSSW